VLAGACRRGGQLGLDVGRNREGDGLAAIPQLLEAAGGAGPVRGRQRLRGFRSPGPHARQGGLRPGREHRRVQDAGPRSGPDESDGDYPHDLPAFEVDLAHASRQAIVRVRQLLGRPGELWGAESAVDKLVVARSSS
jgi:hypothetical protein